MFLMKQIQLDSMSAASMAFEARQKSVQIEKQQMRGTLKTTSQNKGRNQGEQRMVQRGECLKIDYNLNMSIILRIVLFSLLLSIPLVHCIQPFYLQKITFAKGSPQVVQFVPNFTGLILSNHFLKDMQNVSRVQQTVEVQGRQLRVYRGQIEIGERQVESWVLKQLHFPDKKKFAVLGLAYVKFFYERAQELSLFDISQRVLSENYLSSLFVIHTLPLVRPLSATLLLSRLYYSPEQLSVQFQIQLSLLLSKVQMEESLYQRIGDRLCFQRPIQKCMKMLDRDLVFYFKLAKQGRVLEITINPSKIQLASRTTIPVSALTEYNLLSFSGQHNQLIFYSKSWIKGWLICLLSAAAIGWCTRKQLSMVVRIWRALILWVFTRNQRYKIQVQILS